MISALLRHPRSKAFCTACLAAVVAGSLFAQRNGEKTVSANDVEQINDAVLISDISVAGKTVECGLFVKPPAVVQPVTPFQADSDWLRTMTISLVNRTNKVIVFGVIIFHFPDTGDCRAIPCVEAEARFGRMHPVNAFDGRNGKPVKPEQPERQPIAWQPEQTMVIHVSDYMTEIEKNLQNYLPVTSVTKVLIHRGGFHFADGMVWRLGRFAVPDPEHPGRVKELPADFFFGRGGNNWPPGYRQ